MKMYIYTHEVPNSVRVVYDYYSDEEGCKVRKEKDFWVKYID